MGFNEGQNVAIEFRYANNQIDRLPELADELVRRPVAVIVANVLAALAAKNVTATVPILFATGSDPVKDGLVASLNRPGGNVTGVSFVSGALATKRLDSAPDSAQRHNLRHVSQPGRRQVSVRTARGAVSGAGDRAENNVLDVNNAADIETAFATMAARSVDALYVGTGPFMQTYTELVARLAAQHVVPAIYPLRDSVAVGGLMSYGSSITDAYRQVGVYTSRTLKGERPADLPVMQATKFELTLNLKAAKALGLAVPDRVLALADEVVE